MKLGDSLMPVMRKLVKVLFWLACLCVAVGSLTPGDSLPPLRGSDKLLHLLGHGGLAFLGGFAYAGRMRIVMPALVGFGVLLEVLQQLVPNRAFDWYDMVANIAGVLLATVLVLLVRRLISWRQASAR